MKDYSLLVPLIIASVALNTLAQTLLKLGAGKGIVNPYLLGGIGAYGLSTVFYILVLSKLNLSVIYPVVIGLTIVSTVFSGAIFLHEQVPTVQWVGIGLMVSGILAIAFGKSL